MVTIRYQFLHSMQNVVTVRYQFSIAQNRQNVEFSECSLTAGSRGNGADARRPLHLTLNAGIVNLASKINNYEIEPRRKPQALESYMDGQRF